MSPIIQTSSKGYTKWRPSFKYQPNLIHASSKRHTSVAQSSFKTSLKRHPPIVIQTSHKSHPNVIGNIMQTLSVICHPPSVIQVSSERHPCVIQTSFQTSSKTSSANRHTNIVQNTSERHSNDTQTSCIGHLSVNRHPLSVVCYSCVIQTSLKRHPSFTSHQNLMHHRSSKRASGLMMG